MFIERGGFRLTIYRIRGAGYHWGITLAGQSLHHHSPLDYDEATSLRSAIVEGCKALNQRIKGKK